MSIYYDNQQKSWYCKFRYKDWTGKSRSTTKRGFKTKRDAKTFEHEYRLTADKIPEMTIQTLCSKYMVSMKNRLAASTYEDRDGDIRNYILPQLASIQLDQVTKQTIIHWQDWLMSQPPSIRNKKCKSAKKPTGTLAASTIQQKNRILVIILNYAVRMEWIPSNPASNLPRIGERIKRTAFYEKHEYDRFIAAGASDPEFEYYHLCYDIFFYSGMRMAEFRGLGCGSFDFQKNAVIIDHGMNERGKKTKLKTKSSYRTISMPASLMARIRAFMSRLYDVPAYGMFPFSARLLRKHMKAWAKDAGLPYIKIHGLRHSHVSYLINLGVPITAISKRIGHKNPKITLDTYSHMYRQDSDNIASLLESKINVGQTLVT